MTPKHKQTFVVVDGTALAYRSHFAFINRPLVTRKGQVTSAVFGFIIGLRKILEELSPDRVIVVFDAPGPTFRHELSADYKATRERMPDDLRAQLPWIDRYLDAAGLPRLAVAGLEADDVIASLALDAARRDMQALIVSNDKDLLQVIGDDVAVVRPGRGSEPPQIVNAEDVEETLGVRPEQIVDFLALTGDVSDNVRGVPGVGKKTAAKLLGEYGTLDALLAAAPKMKKGKLRDNLIAHRENVEESRRLVRLRTEIGDRITAEQCTRAPADEKALAALFDELEFDSLKRELPQLASSDLAGYRCVDTLTELERLARTLEAAGAFAFDTETTGLDPLRAELVGMSFCAAAGVASYVPIAHENARNVPWEEARRILAPLFADAELPKWGQNVKFDLLVLRRHGLDVQGVDFDSMLASYVLDPSRRSHGLDALAREHLQLETIPLKSLIGSGRNQILISQAPLGDVVNYAAEDADVAFRLRRVLEPEVAASGLEPVLRELELPLLGVLAHMEETGVRLDVVFLQELAARMQAELADLERKAWEAAGERFNLASPKQLQEILFGKLGLKPGRRTKTGLSTDADVLAELKGEHELPGLLLRYREVAKLKSTYVDALPQLVNPETGRLHTSFNQAVTVTGRLSSSEPNLQNVPVRTWEGREIRKAFVPTADDWLLVSCDYSQIELRILAHMARDEALLSAFREGKDVHRQTAARIFDVPAEEVSAEQRAAAKTINFGVIYGMGAVNLGRALGIPTREASRFITSYFERYPGVQEFIEHTQERAREELVVATLTGRRRRVPEIASADHRTRSFGERIAVNTPIQGTAADVMKLAMIAVDGALHERKLRGRMILTVHDELLFDCPRSELEELLAVAVPAMEGAMALDVPLVVETGSGRNWSEAH